MSEILWPKGSSRLPADGSHDVEDWRVESSGSPFFTCDDVGRPLKSGLVLGVHRIRNADGQFATLIVLGTPNVGQPDGASCAASISRLTRQETTVAELIADGMSNKAIAHLLGISPHTARHHTENIFRKLAVRTRSGVTRSIERHLRGANSQPSSAFDFSDRAEVKEAPVGRR